jgi:hypothetical protein
MRVVIEVESWPQLVPRITHGDAQAAARDDRRLDLDVARGASTRQAVPYGILDDRLQ